MSKAKKQDAAPEKSGPQKYEVTRAWNGVEVGQILELENLHPALRANVRKVRADAPVSSGDDVAAAKAQATKIIDDAKVEAQSIKDEAQAEADKIKAAVTPPPPPAK